MLAEGKQVERLAVVEEEQVVAQAQVVYGLLPFGWQYAACPKGPSGIYNFQFPISKIYECIFNYLKSKNCIFFRVEPASIIHNSSFIIQKTIDINPSATLVLDLKKSEEEILAGMHQKTRYNIHLAEKKDLKIKNTPPFIPPLKGEGRGVGLNLEVFWDLMNKTGSRDKFSLHSKKHYEKVLESPIVFQLTAYEKESSVAVAIFIKFGSMFTYLYGASDYEHRHLMAPYLLQWEGIKMGKSLGCEFYDFFGIAPRRHSEQSEESLSFDQRDPSVKPQDDNYEYDLEHQYAGVTRFKLGFGGTPFQAPGTFDVVIDKNKYRLYNFLRKIRRLL